VLKMFLTSANCDIGFKKPFKNSGHSVFPLYHFLGLVLNL